MWKKECMNWKSLLKCLYRLLEPQWIAFHNLNFNTERLVSTIHNTKPWTVPLPLLHKCTRWITALRIPISPLKTSNGFIMTVNTEASEGKSCVISPWGGKWTDWATSKDYNLCWIHCGGQKNSDTWTSHPKKHGLTASSHLKRCFPHGCMDLFPFSHTSISEVGHWCWAIRPGTLVGLKGVEWGWGLSSSPTTHSKKSFFIDPILCTFALSLWKRLGFKVGSTLLSSVSLCTVAVLSMCHC